MPIIIDKLTERPRRSRYPWDEWLDGKARQFVRGRDFDARTESFRMAAISAAKRRGIKVKTQVIDDSTVELQSVEPNLK